MLINTLVSLNFDPEKYATAQINLEERISMIEDRHD